MLTELIEEYAKRYVEISVSANEHYVSGARWRATVRTHSSHYTSSELPTVTFDASGPTADALAANVRRMLDLCEPVIAHREQYLTQRDKERYERIKRNPLMNDISGNLQPNTGAIQ